MTDIVLITCSCPANTGKLSEQAAAHYNLKNPGVVEETMTFRDLTNLKYIDMDDAEVIVLQGCEKDCTVKRLEKEGINFSVVLKTTDLGFERSGTEDPTFAELEKVSSALKNLLREL